MEDLDQLAFENAPMGLALTENRIIRACNQTFVEMFGFKKVQLIGQSFRLLYGTDQEFHQIRDIGLEPLRRSLPYTDERLMRRSDGTPIWCRFRARTLTPETPRQCGRGSETDTARARRSAASVPGPDQQGNGARAESFSQNRRGCAGKAPEEVSGQKRCRAVVQAFRTIAGCHLPGFRRFDLGRANIRQRPNALPRPAVTLRGEA
jgi:PAS domain S-box-containing protein